MTNIEKLYKLAGIENYRLYNYVGFEPKGYKFILNKDNPNKVEKVVRDFSAEKQLELIKWFSENIYCLELSHNGKEFEFYSRCSKTSDKDFSQALASFICYKWNFLTLEQREEVRGILQ